MAIVATSLLAGMPDLESWRPGASEVALLGRSGRRALPDRLGLLHRPDGTPWFRLSIGRQADHTGGAAFLDLGLELLPPAGSDLPMVTWQRGWLLLDLLSVTGASSTTCLEVVPSGPLTFAALLDVDPTSALLLRAALLDGAPLTVAARAVLEVDGAAATAPGTVTIDLAAARDVLAAAAGPDPGTGADHRAGPDTTTAITWDGAVAAVRGAPELIGRAGSGGTDDVTAAAVADRLLARLGTPLPPGRPAEVRYRLPATASGTVRWTLDEPVLGHRFVAAGLDPLAAVTEQLAGADPAALVELRTIPVLDTGLRSISVRDTLPVELTGVDLLSVRLTAAPAPPARPQAAHALVPLRPVPPGPADRTALLRLAPSEPTEVGWRVSVVPGAPARPRPLLGPDRAVAGNSLVVTPADLPVALAAVSASPALLALGTVEIATSWIEAGDRTAGRTDQLSAATPLLHLAIPAPGPDAAPATTALTLLGPAGERLDLGTRPFGSRHADTDDVPGLGSHTVVVELAGTGSPAGDDTVPVLAVELRPEDEASPTPAGVLALTAAARSATWSYVCTNPFRPGLRHRPYRRPDEEPAPWSEAHPPDVPLILGVAVPT